MNNRPPGQASARLTRGTRRGYALPRQPALADRSRCLAAGVVQRVEDAAEVKVSDNGRRMAQEPVDVAGSPTSVPAG